MGRERGQGGRLGGWRYLLNMKRFEVKVFSAMFFCSRNQAMARSGRDWQLFLQRQSNNNLPHALSANWTATFIFCRIFLRPIAGMFTFSSFIIKLIDGQRLPSEPLISHCACGLISQATLDKHGAASLQKTMDTVQ